MKHPWEEISLTDYENHMKLASVKQLQTLNQMMKDQFDAYSVADVMILGIAGGNGLEHIQPEKFKRIYGVDVNPDYLKAVVDRYPQLTDQLECCCINLIDEANKLPNAEMVIADLLIEYIGYECFQAVILQVKPKYVSCVIQINTTDHWVSGSPYLHVFDALEAIHHQIEEDTLVKAMDEIAYRPIKTWEQALPNGKKLVRLDFERVPSAF